MGLLTKNGMVEYGRYVYFWGPSSPQIFGFHQNCRVSLSYSPSGFIKHWESHLYVLFPANSVLPFSLAILQLAMSDCQKGKYPSTPRCLCSSYTNPFLPCLSILIVLDDFPSYKHIFGSGLGLQSVTPHYSHEIIIS